MAISVRGQDEPIHTLWLAIRGGKMELLPLGTTRPLYPARKISPKAIYQASNKSFIGNLSIPKLSSKTYIYIYIY